MSRLSMIELLGRSPVRLAPMAGLTNMPFREIAVACGSGFTTNEEIDAEALLRGDDRPCDAVRSTDAVAGSAASGADDASDGNAGVLDIVAMQLLGGDPATLVPAARRLVAAGADIIDLNMGCPVPKIVRRGKGAALMRDVTATARILEALRRALDTVPLTIKIRGGWDEHETNAVEVAVMAQAVGVDAITVHPRTRAQRFDGRAPWDVIGEVVAAVDIPVTGNGDVRSLAEADAMIAATGCVDVMIGRGALGRPWVFDRDYPALDAAARSGYEARVIGAHLDAIERHFPAPEALLQMKRHLSWYGSGSPDARAWRARLFACDDATELRAAYRARIAATG